MLMAIAITLYGASLSFSFSSNCRSITAYDDCTSTHYRACALHNCGERSFFLPVTSRGLRVFLFYELYFLFYPICSIFLESVLRNQCIYAILLGGKK